MRAATLALIVTTACAPLSRSLQESSGDVASHIELLNHEAHPAAKKVLRFYAAGNFEGACGYLRSVGKDIFTWQECGWAYLQAGKQRITFREDQTPRQCLVLERLFGEAVRYFSMVAETRYLPEAQQLWHEYQRRECQLEIPSSRHLPRFK